MLVTHVVELSLLITSLADTINADPEINSKLQVVFVPDFNVKTAQLIYPAADLSEQISTAGMEASGTGNMKFTMNGALTIGTLDGANIEIREAAGEENFFQFGMSSAQIEEMRNTGYQPAVHYHDNKIFREAIDLITAGHFSHGNTVLFRPLIDSLLQADPYFVCTDFQGYLDCQQEVDARYQNQEHWTRMSVLNVARRGRFSSDRAIREYCEEIWHVKPLPVKM